MKKMCEIRERLYYMLCPKCGRRLVVVGVSENEKVFQCPCGLKIAMPIQEGEKGA